MCLAYRAGTLNVPGELPQDLVPVVGVRPYHHVGVIELASDQPSVIAPMGGPSRLGHAHPREALRQLAHLGDLHARALPWTTTAGR